MKKWLKVKEEDSIIVIGFNNGIADVKVNNDISFQTSYNECLDVSKVTKEIKKALTKEKKLSKNPLSGMFAFGREFKMIISNILKSTEIF